MSFVKVTSAGTPAGAACTPCGAAKPTTAGTSNVSARVQFQASWTNPHDTHSLRLTANVQFYRTVQRRERSSDRSLRGRSPTVCWLAEHAEPRISAVSAGSAFTVVISLKHELRAELHIPRLQDVQRLQPRRSVGGVDRRRRLAGVRGGANGRVRVERIEDVGHQLQPLRSAHA